MSMDTMPFGKYRGAEIEDVPTEYLEWCEEKFDETERAELLKAIQTELGYRRKHGLTVRELGEGYVRV